MKSPVVALMLLMACGGAAVGQESRLIRWRFEAGDRYRVELQSTTEIQTRIAQREKRIGHSLTLTMDWRIESVADETFVILQTVKRIRMTIRIPGDEGIQTTEIDTDSSQERTGLASALLDQITPLVGTTYTFHMTARGEIVDVSAPPEAADMSSNRDAVVTAAQPLTADGMARLLAESAIVFPESAVQAGDQWETTQKIENSFGKTSRIRRYRYQGEQNGRSGDPASRFAVTAEINTSEPGKDDARILDFDERGTILFAPGSEGVLESRMSNRLQTRRGYRDLTVTTTVTSETILTVAENP